LTTGILGTGLALTSLGGGIAAKNNTTKAYVDRTETSSVGRRMASGDTKPAENKKSDGSVEYNFTDPVTHKTIRSVDPSDLMTTRSDDYGKTTYTVPIAGTSKENEYSTDTQYRNVSAVAKNAAEELEDAKKKQSSEHAKIGTTDTSEDKIKYVDNRVSDASSKLDRANKWLYGKKEDGSAGTSDSNSGGMNGLHNSVHTITSDDYEKETKSKYDAGTSTGNNLYAGAAAAGAAGLTGYIADAIAKKKESAGKPAKKK
jgi:hypothetical protein